MKTHSTNRPFAIKNNRTGKFLCRYLVKCNFGRDVCRGKIQWLSEADYAPNEGAYGFPTEDSAWDYIRVQYTGSEHIYKGHPRFSVINVATTP